VRPGTIGLPRLIELLTSGPARCYGLPVGSLVVGKPADVTIFDPEREVTIDRKAMRTKSRNTPFDGRVMHGVVVRTILGGRLVEV